MGLPRELSLLLQFLGSLHKIPELSFKKSLFLKLIREGIAKNKIGPKDEDLEVEFAEGPIDGVLGFYDGRRKRITIDLLEIYIFCVREHWECDGKGNIQEHFDLEVTRVLAHEGGHWHLEKRHGIWPNLEILFLRVFFFVIGLVIGYFLITNIVSLITEVVLPFLFGLNQVVGYFYAASISLVTFFLGFEILSRYFVFVSMVSQVFTYKVCYHERFARKFEERPDKDSRWKEVIIVQEEGE